MREGVDTLRSEISDAGADRLKQTGREALDAAGETTGSGLSSSNFAQACATWNGRQLMSAPGNDPGEALVLLGKSNPDCLAIPENRRRFISTNTGARGCPLR
jgi:hypothetical protein